MHSHDRTLISRLGFDDPDKRNSRHDLACQYLAQDEVADKVINKVFAKMGGEKEKSKVWYPRIHNEEPLTKGEGQYETIVGFLDVWYSFDSDDKEWDFIIEVKCSECSINDIIRQIKFYRESSKNCDKFSELVPRKDSIGRTIGEVRRAKIYTAWVVVLDFEISESEEDLFLQEDIEVLRLGENFERWVLERKGQPSEVDQSWDATDI